MDRPIVASVLLVAESCRADELALSLSVRGAFVRYALEVLAPASILTRTEGVASRFDVVVVDGGSLVDQRSRRNVLARARSHDSGLATVLYLCTRLPTSEEIVDARAYADDLIEAGWDLPRRLAMRVQAIAFAPWRRAAALRRHALAAGDRRLRVLQPTEGGVR